MQTLEQIICGISQVKEGQLLAPALHAVNNPDHGIQVKNPVALKVIRDCAYVSTQYLPFYVLSKLVSPFSFLQKQVSLDQIKDFYTRSQSDPVANQLMTLLIDKAKTQFNINVDSFYDHTDPYNDFDQKTAELQKMHNYVYILSKAFGLI